MKREDIEKAAVKYSNDVFLDNVKISVDNPWPEFRDTYKTAFESGVDWHMNSVWHDDKERPVPMKECIVFLCAPRRMGWHIGRIEEQGGNKGKWNIYGYFTPASHNEVKGWAYIEDLLPDAE